MMRPNSTQLSNICLNVYQIHWLKGDNRHYHATFDGWSLVPENQWKPNVREHIYLFGGRRNMYHAQITQECANWRGCFQNPIPRFHDRLVLCLGPRSPKFILHHRSKPTILFGSPKHHQYGDQDCKKRDDQTSPGKRQSHPKSRLKSKRQTTPGLTVAQIIPNKTSPNVWPGHSLLGLDSQLGVHCKMV